MRAKRILRTTVIALLTCFVLGGSAVGAILWSIQGSVREYCAAAQEAYPHPGDDVSALIDLMDSDTRPLRDRNHAIWALGRMKDPRALPHLQYWYTGGPCDHDHNPCQYELEKAIARCDKSRGPAGNTED